MHNEPSTHVGTILSLAGFQDPPGPSLRGPFSGGVISLKFLGKRGRHPGQNRAG